MHPVRHLAAFALALLASVPAFAPAAAPLAPADAADLLARPDRILLRAAQIDVAAGPPAAPRESARPAPPEDDRRYWIVHLRIRPAEALRSGLEDRGAEILHYLPNHAYLVRAASAKVRDLAGAPAVDWIGPYRPDYRIAPEVPASGSGDLRLAISLFDGEDPDGIAGRAAALGARVLAVNRHPRAPRLTVSAPVDLVEDLAAIEGIEWIEPAANMTPRNNTTRWVAQSNQVDVTPVWDAGIHGEGQIIGHADDPLGEQTCWFIDPEGDPPGPLHRKLVAYRGTMGAAVHGTHTAGTAAGWNVDGSLDHAGIAYAARLTHTVRSLITKVEGSFYGYLETAHLDGARVHTNSWGDDFTTAYTAWCRDIDRFSRDHDESLVVFASTNSSTLKTPENSRNVLAVGATQQAPSQDSHCFGGVGPTSDGRRKPEIYLPGCSIRSAGTAGCFTISQGGTSMATPAVAACAALVRQYYEEGFHPGGAANPADAFTPTAALVKATLLNGTEDMDGVAGYPSDLEGWGRLNLERALHFPGDGVDQVVRDVRSPAGLTTGQAQELALTVGSGQPFQVTLAYTDQPAALGAAIVAVNDLDLEVEGPSGLFLGNVFAGGVSVTGGSADPLNNVERVVLPAGSFAAGEWTVRVLGASVPVGPQDYAIHVSGEVSESVVVDADVASAEPWSTRLFPGNPNPFRTATTIRFSLPSRTEAELVVYDVGGRRVRVLTRGTLGPGEHSALWDGRDDAGDLVGAGVYFYRLTGPGIDERRRIVRIR